MRLIRIAATVLIVAAGAAPAAAAPPRWVPPEAALLSAAAFGDQVAMTASGTVVTVRDVPGDSPRVDATVRAPGGARETVPLGPGSWPVAAAAGEEAVVGWQHGGATQAAIRSAAGSFGAAAALTGPEISSGYSPGDVAILPSGEAAVVFTALTASAGAARVAVARRRAGEGFSPAVVVSDAAPTAAYKPEVALDGDGDAVVAWRETGAIGYRRIARDGTLGPLRKITPAGSDYGDLCLAVAADGAARLLWSTEDGTLRAAAAGPGADFAPAVSLTGSGALIGPAFDLAIDTGGRAVATWSGTTGRARTFVAEAAPGAPFSAGRPISPAGVDANGVRAAAGPGGHVLLGWWERDDAGTSTMAAAHAAPGAFPEPLPAGPGADATPGEIAVTLDEQGNGALSWYEFGEELRVVGIDAAPPRIEAIVAPAQVEAGRRVAFSARAVDVWSALDAASIAFGDGFQYSGLAAERAFDRPGAATVTFRAADGLGNVAAVERGLQVTPPADPPITATDRVAPVLSRVRVDRRGRRLRFVSSEAGRARIVLERCARSRRGRCLRWRRTRLLVRPAAAGANAVTLASRRPRGRLRLRLQVTDAAGNASRLRTVSFRG